MSQGYLDFPQEVIDDKKSIVPLRDYKSIELFAGCGAMSLGFEDAGLDVVMLNELCKDPCDTIRKNRPDWNLIEDDIKNIDFTQYKNIDFVSGGFPCQAFTTMGDRKGFEDKNGMVFFEFVRAIKEIQPSIFLGENVRGLLHHDSGKTILTMKDKFEKIGYHIYIKLMKAILYKVPQKRNRVIFIGVRKDLADKNIFKYPNPYGTLFSLKDAFKKGRLYDSDVPNSKGYNYNENFKRILNHVKQGEDWYSLSGKIKKELFSCLPARIQGLLKTWGGVHTTLKYIGGRLRWDSPSPTLVSNPFEHRNWKCHPEELRPLNIREYARLQTIPDNWEFCGSICSQYKQLGNTFPVNMAYHLGKSIISFLNKIEHEKTTI